MLRWKVVTAIKRSALYERPTPNLKDTGSIPNLQQWHEKAPSALEKNCLNKKNLVLF